MGLFSSSSSSSTTKNYTETTTISKTAGQQGEGQALNLADVTGSSISYRPTDQGVVKEGFAFAKESQALFGQNFNTVTGLIEKSGDKAIQSQRIIADALNQQDAQQRSAGIASVLPVVSGAVIIGGIVLVVRAFRGK